MAEPVRADPPFDGPPSPLPVSADLAALAEIEQALARIEDALRGMHEENTALLTSTREGQPSEHPEPAGASRAERMRIPIAPARDVAARRRARSRALDATFRFRPSAKRPLRVAAAIIFTGVLAVQVLAIGRPSQGRPAAFDTVPGAPTHDAATPIEPAAPTSPPPAPTTDVMERPATVDVAPTARRIAPPVSLRVPAIAVDARIVVVGLEPDGAMEIPADVRTVGWYEPYAGAGVVPGEAGTAVIAGHVDSRTQGRGAFWPLRELVPGDVVDVEHSDGTVSRWRVESVVRHPKTDIPIEDIFTFAGDERLALITCGGEFDRSAGAYLDNYVVTAVPLPPAVTGGGQALPTAP